MKIQALLRRFAGVSGVCAFALGASLAHATALPLTGTGFANGSESFTLTAPPSVYLAENPVPAGGFIGVLGTTPPTPLIFWCAELSQTFSFGDTQPYNVSLLTNTNLSRLFTEVGGSAAATATTQSSAAFQIAIWEILFESNTTSPYSVSTGNFTATGDSGAVNQANAWLANLGQFAASTILISLTNESHQDFITDVMPPGFQTPEPASLALLGVGMLAAMIAMRRRTQKVGRQ